MAEQRDVKRKMKTKKNECEGGVNKITEAYRQYFVFPTSPKQFQRRKQMYDIKDAGTKTEINVTE